MTSHVRFSFCDQIFSCLMLYLLVNLHGVLVTENEYFNRCLRECHCLQYSLNSDPAEQLKTFVRSSVHSYLDLHEHDRQDELWFNSHLLVDRKSPWFGSCPPKAHQCYWDFCALSSSDGCNPCSQACPHSQVKAIFVNYASKLPQVLSSGSCYGLLGNSNC